MNQQVNKYLQNINQLANQVNSLLTTKQMELAQNFIQKCIPLLMECDKILFIKFLASFLKLFLLSPFIATQMFYKKSYIIMKQGYLTKIKNSQEKYQCLIYALFDCIEKYFSTIYGDALKVNKSQITCINLNENILNLNIKGFLNLKGFINLLRKIVQREGQNAKINEILILLRDYFFKMIADLQEDFKKNNKIIENYGIKFYFYNSIFKEFLSKYETKTINFLKDNYKLIISNDQAHQKLLIYFQFLRLNQLIPFITIFKDDNKFNNNEISLQFYNKNTVLIDLMTILILFQSLNWQSDSNKDNLFNLLYLVKSRYKSLFKNTISVGNKIEVNFDNFLLEKSLYLQKFILQLLLKMKIHINNLEYSKISILSIIKSLISINSVFYQLFLHNQYILQQIFENEIYIKLIKTNKNLTIKSRIYLSILYYYISIFNNNDYNKKIYIQQIILNIFGQIIQNQYYQYINNQFFQELYLFINFKISKSHYLDIIFKGYKIKKQSNIIQDILEKYRKLYYNDMIQQQKIDQYINQNINRFQKGYYTYQNIIDIITQMLQQRNNDHRNTYDRQQNKQQFYQLSLLLFDKINIKPKIINKKQDAISFLINKKQLKYQYCILFCKKLLQIDKKIKQNIYFMKSIPKNDLNNQKIIINCLRKYFGIYYNRVNQHTIRKWIINRQYSIIWCLLLANYKVKTICQQFLKLGINSSQFTAFFNIQTCILKDFLDYIVTKDKYKFKLALFNNGFKHKKQLIDYSIVDLLV